MITNNIDVEVVVAGGGLTGLACALRLAHTGLSVMVIEATSADPVMYCKPGFYEARVSAITPASVSLFQKLDAWALMAAERLSPFTQIAVWEQHKSTRLHFDSQSIGQPVLGYIVENSVMLSAFFQKITQLTSVIYKAPDTIAAIQLAENAITLALASGERVNTKLLIAADGALSHLRTLAGIPVSRKFYPEQALVATIKTEKPHNKTARQCFSSTDILAFLPLAEANYCSIVWSQPTEQAQGRKTLSPEEFCCTLKALFGEELGDLALVSERHVFPLMQSDANTYIAPRVALIGDAAHTFHPLAGQGVNAGFQDVVALVSFIEKALSEQRDIGSQALLRRYERFRHYDNALMSKTIDSVYHFFRTESETAARLREMGFSLTEHCQPLKNALMQRAMGLSFIHRY